MSELSEKYDAAVALQQEGQLDQAIEGLEALLVDQPDYALAHSALCKFYSDKEQHDKAIEHGLRVCALEPSDPFSFTALSMVAQKADQREQAEEALMKARELQVAAQMQQPGE